MHLLIVITFIQFWWIAIWGLAYIVIDATAGTSTIKKAYIYGCMLLFTVIVLHFNPTLLDRL